MRVKNWRCEGNSKRRSGPTRYYGIWTRRCDTPWALLWSSFRCSIQSFHVSRVSNRAPFRGRHVTNERRIEHLDQWWFPAIRWSSARTHGPDSGGRSSQIDVSRLGALRRRSRLRARGRGCVHLGPFVGVARGVVLEPAESEAYGTSTDPQMGGYPGTRMTLSQPTSEERASRGHPAGNRTDLRLLHRTKGVPTRDVQNQCTARFAVGVHSS